MTEYTPKNRLEVVLLALGFSNEKDEERNPNECWFNKYFNGIEVELKDDGSWVMRGPSSTYIEEGDSDDYLAQAVKNMLMFTMSILADQECGIR